MTLSDGTNTYTATSTEAILQGRPELLLEMGEQRSSSGRYKQQIGAGQRYVATYEMNLIPTRYKALLDFITTAGDTFFYTPETYEQESAYGVTFPIDAKIDILGNARYSSTTAGKTFTITLQITSSDRV